MSAARILAVFLKDAVDALRDSRILVALVVPIGLAVVYNQTFDDDPARVRATVAVTGETVVAARLARDDPAAEIRVRRVTPAEATRLVQDDEADLGVIVPSGFDEAVRAARTPVVRLLVADGGGGAGAALARGALEAAVADLAGARPAVEVRVERVVGADGSVVERLGIARYFVLASLAILVAFIAFLVVPVILSEEIERRTLDALLLAARPAEILLAKSLVGILYTLLAVPLALLLTGLEPQAPGRFAVGALGMAVSLIVFGLLFALALGTAARVNTWSGIVVLVVTIPVFLVGAPLSSAASAVVAATPTGAGARLMVDGLAGEALLGEPLLAVLVLAAWTAAGAFVLVRALSRREL